MIRFRYFSHFRIPLDTTEHVSHIRASPSKHRTNAVEEKQLCSDRFVRLEQREDSTKETLAQVKKRDKSVFHE
jgi:hypothetical protein